MTEKEDYKNWRENVNKNDIVRKYHGILVNKFIYFLFKYWFAVTVLIIIIMILSAIPVPNFTKLLFWRSA